METGRICDRDNEEDRISDLAEFLIHQILSYLPPKEAARTTVLSKTWLQSYSTSPFLTFKECFFHKSAEIMEKRYPFFNFVNNTLFRYTSLNLRIQKLQITVFGVDHEHAYRLLDDSLGVAVDNGVQELTISSDSDFIDFEFSPYTLPTAMFDSPKLLTYLRVHNCIFPQNVANNPKCKTIIFPFLHTVIMNFAYIDDQMLQKLLSSCPSLEKIVFFEVFGFKKLQVCNLVKLKILDIISRNTIEIEIEDAPSLRLLKYKNHFRSPCLLKVGSNLQSRNLKRLELYSVIINDNCMNDIITKFPLLEHLKIGGCNELERINIVSDSLKHLDFERCKMLVETRIDAPNLLELRFYGENMLTLSLNNTPDELKTFIWIDHSDLNRLDNAWFKQLKKLLKVVNQARVYFSIWSLNQGIEFAIAHNSRENPLPPAHLSENFMPHINQSSSLFTAFVETLFSSSHPATIDTSLFRSSYAEFVKFLSNELMTTTRNPNCCSSDQTKCWRHYLEDINVEVYEVSHNVWQPLLWETSLSEFTFGGRSIRFRLKWYANLNAEV